MTGRYARARRGAVLIALASIFCVAASGARAGDTGALTIKGTVTPSCGITGPGGTVNLGNVSAAGSHQFTMTVNCNAPFAYAAVSANGALVSTGAPSVVTGSFNQSLPYTLTTDFTTDGADFGHSNVPSSALTDANAAPCLAATYDAAGCATYFGDSGTTVAINKSATLTVRWSNPANPLLAGSYTDTITITVRAM